MSEQAKILAQMYELITNILKTGQASEEEGKRIDELEEMLLQQKCYEKVDNAESDYLGEEIARLFFNEKYEEAVNKLYENAISPEDFFAFAEYHFDEEEDEENLELFTQAFMVKVKTDYEAK